MQEDAVTYHVDANTDGNDVCLDLDNVTLLVNPAALLITGDRPLDKGRCPAPIGPLLPRLWGLTGPLLHEHLWHQHQQANVVLTRRS